MLEYLKKFDQQVSNQQMMSNLLHQDLNIRVLLKPKRKVTLVINQDILVPAGNVRGINSAKQKKQLHPKLKWPKQPGHRVRDCPDVKKRICTICHKTGHWEKDCKQKTL